MGTNALLEAYVEEREDVNSRIDAILEAAQERENSDLTESENQLLERSKGRLEELDKLIDPLADLEERRGAGRDVKDLLERAGKKTGKNDDGGGGKGEPEPRPAWMDADPYRMNRDEIGFYQLARHGRRYEQTPWQTFAHYARDVLVTRYDSIMHRAGGVHMRDQAQERLTRVPANTLTSDVAGLLPGTHMAQIMDVIDLSRPLVSSARSVPLDNGKLTYPKITQRPTAAKQTTEKTETASQKLTVSMESMSADTFLGAGDLSWQTINWTSPGALQLWFDLCAEAYARQTETEAGTEMNTSVTATEAIPGTTAADSTLDAWWTAIINAAASAYENTGSRVMPNTVWTSPDRFFTLIRLMAPQGTAPALAAIGSLDLTTVRGNIAGLTLVGTPGLPVRTTVVGDARAFLVGEQEGSPVELRAVEPSIAGMEVGVVGAFKSKNFDATRFVKITNAVF